MIRVFPFNDDERIKAKAEREGKSLSSKKMFFRFFSFVCFAGVVIQSVAQEKHCTIHLSEKNATCKDGYHASQTYLTCGFDEDQNLTITHCNKTIRILSLNFFYEYRVWKHHESSSRWIRKHVYGMEQNGLQHHYSKVRWNENWSRNIFETTLIMPHRMFDTWTFPSWKLWTMNNWSK